MSLDFYEDAKEQLKKGPYPFTLITGAPNRTLIYIDCAKEEALFFDDALDAYLLMLRDTGIEEVMGRRIKEIFTFFGIPFDKHIEHTEEPWIQITKSDIDREMKKMKFLWWKFMMAIKSFAGVKFDQTL